MTDRLDSKDVEILKRFKKDSRTPMGIIGKKMDISKATVSRRVSKMEETGIIRGYSIDVDLSSMGILKSLISIQVIGSPVNEIIEVLKKLDSIGDIYKTFGDHNIVCVAYALSVNELYEMIQSKILTIYSVKNVQVDAIIEKVPLHEGAELNMCIKALKEKE